MNTSQIKNFAIQSRNVLKEGVLNRILALGFDEKGNPSVDLPVKIQGGTIFMGQLREEGFYDAWTSLAERLEKKGIKEVCEEAAYTWFNRLVAIRIMQKNGFIEPVMQYASSDSRIPVIVDQARSGRLSLLMTAQDRDKLNELLRDSTKTNEQFNLLISAFCQANPVIFKCFGGIEKHIALLLPDNILSQGGFIDMLNNTPYLTDEDYAKSELIGWLYQFYISEKKDEVFAKKGKYTPDEIPAATQIFTPNWIVKYMVENTIGRIYLDNNPYADEIKESMKYLVEPTEPTPKDAILKLEDLTEYKMIDNACGSGHILIEGFNLFYRMYMYEGYSSRQAIENIFRKNIIGIDLDTRAKQLATFALLMTAAKVDKSFLDCKVMPRVLDFPEPFVYHGGTWEDFFPHYYLGCSERVMKETRAAFELMKDASSLGSIMKFDLSAETRTAMEKATAEWEKKEYLPEDIATAVQSMKVILALTDKYSAAAMNPPYMGIKKMGDRLKEYVEIEYPESKYDLSTCFMERLLSILRKNGKLGMINLHSWMFLTSYDDFRKTLLDKYHLDSLIHLGARTFDELSGEVVQNASFVYSNNCIESKSSCYRLVDEKGCANKQRLFLSGSYHYQVDTSSFSNLPGSNFGYWLSDSMMKAFEGKQLGDIAAPRQGMATSDNDRFIRFWAEVAFSNVCLSAKSREESVMSRAKWFPYNKGGHYRKWYGNNELLVNWQNDGKELLDLATALYKSPTRTIKNISYYFQESITWSALSNKLSLRYTPAGYLFDTKGQCIFSDTPGIKEYLMAFLNSAVSVEMLKLIAPTLDFNSGSIALLPIKNSPEDIRSSIVGLSRNCVSSERLDWDAHETSWDFKVNELVRIYKGENSSDGRIENANRLEDIVTLYKEHWTEQFMKLHSNEEELNRQFIEIYGLQDELTPDVPLNEITILQNGEISIVDNKIVWHDDVIIKQLISYAIGCWMGRYRLDKEGLYIAHRPTDDKICTYDYNGFKFEIDDDAIIPLMGKDNPFEDDNALQKCINFLKYVFGGDSFLTKNMNYVEHCLGKPLEDYLIKDFWKDHKKMYQNRPIYWLFASKKGAFQVLTYMHRMNPYTVERIRTKYLLPYIEYLKGRIEVDEARGADLSTVERKNLQKMKTALEECNEYHDRLHEVALAAIDFDLDDGVVVNYAKFGDVLSKIK